MFQRKIEIVTRNLESNIYRQRVMIEYHLKIQFFTTLPMWQGGPLP